MQSTDFLYISSKEGIQFQIHVNNLLFKNEIVNFNNLKEGLNWNSETLYLLITNNFEEMNYDYIKMINHAQKIFYLDYKKHNQAWLQYFKKIVYSHNEMYYYKYHLNIFFNYYSIDYIIENFSSIDLLIKKIKNDKIPYDSKYYHKYYGDILTNNIKNPINYKIIFNDECLTYHILKNNTFIDISYALYNINFFTKKTLDLFFDKYGEKIVLSLHLNFHESIFFPIKKNNFFDKFFEENFEEQYEKLLLHYQYNDYKNLIYNCIFYSLHKNVNIEILNVLFNKYEDFENIFYEFIKCSSNYSMKCIYFDIEKISILYKLGLMKNFDINAIIFKYSIINNFEDINIISDILVEKENVNKYFSIFFKMNNEIVCNFLIDYVDKNNVNNEILTYIKFNKKEDFKNKTQISNNWFNKIWNYTKK